MGLPRNQQFGIINRSSTGKFDPSKPFGDVVVASGAGVTDSASAPSGSASSATYDYYISTTGTGSASSGGTLADPWPISMLNDATARARYAGKRVGLLDGTYDLYSLANAASDHIPVLNIEGGSSGSPTIIAAVNLRGAWLNAKNGSTYGGTSDADGTQLIGNNYIGGVTGGNVTLDGLKISGSKGNPLWFGTNGGSTTPGIIVKNCEIFDCSAVGLASGGNIAAITMNQGDGFQALNNYIHDIVGVTAGHSDHMSCIQTWNTINQTIQYITAVNAGALLYPKVGTQYNIEVAYNYCDASGYSDGSNCVQDALSTSPVVSGTYLKIHHNVFKALSAGIAIMQGGTAHECGSEDVQIYNNTIDYVGSSSATDYQGFINCNKHNLGPKIYNNLCCSTTSTAAGVNTTGAIWVSAGPPRLIDYNMYPTAVAKWSVTTNDATFYPTAGGTTLTGGTYPWTALVSGATGAEAHSLQSNITAFVGSGSFAAAYQLTSSSAAYNAGRVGGMVGGAQCHLGAWDGTTSQIGYSPSVRM